MKKRLIVFLVATILCLAISSPAFAAIVPCGSIGLSSGLTHVSGSSYRAWASVQAFLDEDLTVSFTLYRVTGDSLTYITSSSASAYGTSVKAEKTVSLSTGSYEIHASCSGDTQSYSNIKTFIVS